ncbi:MAG: hypothetical protein IJT00_02560, partial [Lachnospiraceae bacterium]|nr:hypothetical protein [Lachnospiraceae bacterium]
INIMCPVVTSVLYGILHISATLCPDIPMQSGAKCPDIPMQNGAFCPVLPCRVCAVAAVEKKQ